MSHGTAQHTSTRAEDLARREAIEAYRILGEPPAADLQGLVELASAACGVRFALINIIDEGTQHSVAAVGIEASACSREDSMCNIVFQQAEPVFVPDAQLDERFRDNPFVNGEIANVRLYASSPLIAPGGLPIGTLCVFDNNPGDLSPGGTRALDVLARQIVDVLELRRMTRELVRSNDQLAHFAGQVSHDLRNPLAALFGFLELAATSPELEGAADAGWALGRAEAAAKRMLLLVDDLLSFAQLGASPRREPVDLAAVLAAAVEDLDAAVVETGATIDVGALPTIIGDTTMLRALMQNLLSNAIKFAAAEGARPHIEVRATPVSAGWRITVDDNGPGIAEDARTRVFGLLERAGRTDLDGHGIGLSTCRRIVDAHGGSIGIDDTHLGGASVWALLPDH
ncbi:ATP-binding protein [Agrococcus sp. ProA11]|uniref:sensor histidine kinase n=1 Tax=Agrococcus chionoecetis TaxID=3153752 RepID=UPI00326174A3